MQSIQLQTVVKKPLQGAANQEKAHLTGGGRELKQFVSDRLIYRILAA